MAHPDEHRHGAHPRPNSPRPSDLPPAGPPAGQWAGRRARALLAAGLLAGLDAIPAAAHAELSGDKTILLSGAAGEVRLGSVSFAADGSYSLNLDDSLFGNHFLSMRPFKCMTGPQDMWCHLPYPYGKPDRLAGDDLRPLEYDLLFIHRKASDYGIDAWNGLYFALRRDGDGLIGALHEVDLNVLAAPPESDELPISHVDLSAADPDRHWLPHLEIR